MTMFNITDGKNNISRDKPVEIGNNVRRIVMGDRDSTRRAGYVDTLLAFLINRSVSHGLNGGAFPNA